MKNLIVFFFIVCLKYLGVQENTKYFKQHFYKLTDSPTKMDSSNLFNYDFYFFGETHNATGSGQSQTKVLEILYKYSNCILTEYPSNYLELLNDYFYKQNIDTTAHRFSYFFKYKEYIKLMRSVFVMNSQLPISRRKKLIPIDISSLKQFESQDILQYYKDKEVTTIRDDLKLLEDNDRNFRKKKGENYIKFYSFFKLNRDSHIEIIGAENYKKIDKYLEGLLIYLQINKDGLWFKSPLREDYMFQNVSDEINNSNDSLKFIILNGHFHIPLSVQKEWVGAKNWESLAYKVKTAYPSKKVCSIYFMSRTKDRLSDQYFPIEKKIILDNIKPGETYLIRLDGENSPFKELSEKFQYIVVW